MTRRFWLSIFALALAAAAVAYYQFGDVAAEVPVLNSAEATRGAVVSTIEATGRLEAVTTVQVGSQVSGSIKTLYADFNSTVRQGQVIAELDPSLFETQVEQAVATVARLEAEVERSQIQAADAQVKLRRSRELFEKQLVPENDLETAESDARMAGAGVTASEAQVEQARASLNQAQVNLSHTIIRAPIDGVVIARNVDIGQTVAASMSAPTLYVLARESCPDARQRQRRRIRHRRDSARPAGAFPGRRLSRRDLHGSGVAGAPGAGDSAERRELRDDHRRAQSGPQAETRHDRCGDR